MAKIAKVRNILISGETITVEMIPTGVMQPNTESDTGPVAVCAPTDAASGDASFCGKIRTRKS